ncbi:MAG: hypothetical protein DDT26_02200 [Dehalococcoidia bacterium]|nr:hypothetical protein [Chloroflexota bacterium]
MGSYLAEDTRVDAGWRKAQAGKDGANSMDRNRDCDGNLAGKGDIYRWARRSGRGEAIRGICGADSPRIALSPALANSEP